MMSQPRPRTIPETNSRAATPRRALLAAKRIRQHAADRPHPQHLPGRPHHTATSRSSRKKPRRRGGAFSPGPIEAVNSPPRQCPTHCSRDDQQNRSGNADVSYVRHNPISTSARHHRKRSTKAQRARSVAIADVAEPRPHGQHQESDGETRRKPQSARREGLRLEKYLAARSARRAVHRKVYHSITLPFTPAVTTDAAPRRRLARVDTVYPPMAPDCTCFTVR